MLLLEWDQYCLDSNIYLECVLRIHFRQLQRNETLQQLIHVYVFNADAVRSCASCQHKNCFIKLPRVLQDIVYVAPEAIVIAIYWLLNTVLLICAIICVWSYWQVRIKE